MEPFNSLMSDMVRTFTGAIEYSLQMTPASCNEWTIAMVRAWLVWKGLDLLIQPIVDGGIIGGEDLLALEPQDVKLLCGQHHMLQYTLNAALQQLRDPRNANIQLASHWPFSEVQQWLYERGLGEWIASKGLVLNDALLAQMSEADCDSLQDQHQQNQPIATAQGAPSKTTALKHAVRHWQEMEVRARTQPASVDGVIGVADWSVAQVCAWALDFLGEILGTALKPKFEAAAVHGAYLVRFTREEIVHLLPNRPLLQESLNHAIEMLMEGRDVSVGPQTYSVSQLGELVGIQGGDAMRKLFEANAVHGRFALAITDVQSKLMTNAPPMQKSIMLMCQQLHEALARNRRLTSMLQKHSGESRGLKLGAWGWNKEDVGRWLDLQGEAYARIKPSFQQRDVDGTSLLLMNEQQVDECVLEVCGMPLLCMQLKRRIQKLAKKQQLRLATMPMLKYRATAA
jgi:hypothetical protein